MCCLWVLLYVELLKSQQELYEEMNTGLEEQNRSCLAHLLWCIDFRGVILLNVRESGGKESTQSVVLQAQTAPPATKTLLSHSSCLGFTTVCI